MDSDSSVPVPVPVPDLMHYCCCNLEGEEVFATEVGSEVVAEGIVACVQERVNLI